MRWSFLQKIKQTDWKMRKKGRQKRGIKKSGCGRKIPYENSSWDTSLFCIRRIRRWYCHDLHMNEEAIQNEEKN